ncbi:MAG: hypothetical protein SFV15_25575 [Polyangiaceae bacterium]|nr:hypothetical protein [Polyangiaceae bacterium]
MPIAQAAPAQSISSSSGGAAAVGMNAATGLSTGGAPVTTGGAPVGTTTINTGLGANTPPPNGCGTANLDTPPISAASLCPGTPGISLAVRTDHSDKCTHAPATIRDGVQFLLVTGECRFFALTDAMQGVRTGVLTSEMATQLIAQMGLANYPNWSLCSTSESCPFRITQPPTWRISVAGFDGEVRVCEGGMTPSVASIEPARHWLNLLAASGEPLIGPIRVTAVGPSSNEFPWPHQASWPLSYDLQQIAQAGTPGTLITDAMETSALRSLRAGFIDTAETAYCSMKIVTTPTERYDVLALDELPAELLKSLEELDAKLTP